MVNECERCVAGARFAASKAAVWAEGQGHGAHAAWKAQCTKLDTSTHLPWTLTSTFCLCL